MMFQRKIALIAVLGCLCIYTIAADESFSPRELVKKSLHISLTTSYQSIIPASDKEKATYNDSSAKYKIFYSVQKNGVVCERRDLIVKERMVLSYIANSKGNYSIVYPPGAKAVIVKLTGELPHYNPWKSWKFPFRLIEKDLQSKDCQYQFAGSASYQGIPCKKIMVSLPFPSDEDLAKRLNLPVEEVKKEKEYLKSTFSVRRVYLIGMRNFFLYQCSYYNEQGKQTFSAEWGDARFNAPLPEDLFRIPEGKYTEFGDHDSFAELEKKISQKNIGFLGYTKKFFSRIGDFFSQNISAILIWGGWIAFWLAVVTIVLAGILKLRAKK